MLFIAAVGFLVAKHKKEEKIRIMTFYPLKDRAGSMAKSGEAKQVKKQFADLMKIVRTNPGRYQIKNRIGFFIYSGSKSYR
jgi:hypothetical protein